MQDPRSEHRKGESPFQKANKENPPLRRDTEGRRGSGSCGKENSPLHTANWQSSLHRKSHRGVNWKNQDNPAAVPDPLPPSRQHPTRTAPWNSHTPRCPYKQARRSKGKQLRTRTQLEHIPGGASSLHPALLEFDLQGGASSLQATAHEGASSLHRAPHQYPGGALSLHSIAREGASSLHGATQQHQGGALSLHSIVREGASSLHGATQQYQGRALSLPLQRSDYPDVTLQVWPEPPFDGQASRTPREGQQPVNPVSRVPREDQLAESSNSRLPREDQQTWNPASPLQPSESPASRVPREDQPPTVIEIPCGSPHPAEGRPHTPDSPQCPETPGKWFRPDLHRRSSVRARSPSPPSPRRPRKRSPPSLGWWMDHRMRK